MTAALRQNVVTHDRYLEVIQMDRRYLHPLVIEHPDSGRKALYLSPTYTTHIDGLANAESDGPIYQLREWYSQFFMDEDDIPAKLKERQVIVTMEKQES